MFRNNLYRTSPSPSSPTITHLYFLVLNFDFNHTVQGAWKNNQRWGQGTLEYKNGGILIGMWQGEAHGPGEFRNPEEGWVYRGMFRNGQRESAAGALVYEDGTRYNGGFHAGMKSGSGTVRLVSGDEITVEFENDTFATDRVGQCNYVNGAVFRGN